MSGVLDWNELELHKVFMIVKIEILKSPFWRSDWHLFHLKEESGTIHRVWGKPKVVQDILAERRTNDTPVFVMRTALWSDEFLLGIFPDLRTNVSSDELVIKTLELNIR